MNRKLYWTDFISLLIVILTFAGLFMSVGMSSIGYLDEIITLLCIVFIGYGIARHRFTSQESIALVLVGCFLLIGLLGNIIFGYRTEVMLIILDMIASIKGMAYYFGFRALRIAPIKAKRIINGVYYLCLIYIIIAFSFSILNLLFDFGMRDERGYSIPGFKFLYTGSANASVPYFVVIGCAALKISLQKGLRRIDYVYLLFGLVSWSLTLTSRAIGFSVLYIVLFFFVVYLSGKKRFRFRVWQCASLGILLFFIGRAKFIDYFLNDETARYNLIYYGLVILKDCFPIGAGFGTFGSSVSAKYYSPLYVKLGLQNIYGLSRDYAAFVTDGLWGELFGQFGFLGTGCFIIVICMIFISLYKKCKHNYARFAILYIALILLLDSIGTNTYMHFVIAPVFILLALWSKATETNEGDGKI